MTLTSNQQLSVLASATGLVLIAFYLITLYLGIDTVAWLPDMVAGIAGFELAMFGRGQWTAFRRRRANRRGGERG